MEFTMQLSQKSFTDANVQSNDAYERVPNFQLDSFQNDIVTTSPKNKNSTTLKELPEDAYDTYTDSEDKGDSSNIFSCSSSLSEEMDIDETTENRTDSDRDENHLQTFEVVEHVTQNPKETTSTSSVVDKSSELQSLYQNKETHEKLIVPRFFGKKIDIYTHIIPDDRDPHYFCRVCQSRSVSRSAYYEHLAGHHRMSLIPLENWRIDDPEIIPAEFDDSHCCISCQAVFPTTPSYRNHLSEYHKVHFVNWSKLERKVRKEAIFNNTADFVLYFARIFINPSTVFHQCCQCSKKLRVLRSFVKHYFTEHNIIVEICMESNQSEQGKTKENNKENNAQEATKNNANESSTTQKSVAKIRQSEILSPMNTNVKLSITSTEIDNNTAKPAPTTQQMEKQDLLVTLGDWEKSNCYKCQRTYVTRRYLLVHLFKYHGQHNIQCAKCSVVFQNLQASVYHFTKFHEYPLGVILKNSQQKEPTHPSLEDGNEQSQSSLLNQEVDFEQDTSELEGVEGSNDLDTAASKGEAPSDEETASQVESPSLANDCLEGVDNISLTTFTENLMVASESKCHICDISFDSRYATLMHFVESHKSESPEVSEGESNERNDVEYEEEETIDKNVATNSQYSCDICVKSFKTRYPYIKHKKIDHAQKPIRRGERKRKAVIIKIKKRRGPVKGAKLCKVCRKLFKNKTSLNLHSRIHAVESSSLVSATTYSCQACNLKFQHESDLQIHHSESHTNEKNPSTTSTVNVSTYQCHHCDKIFNSIRTLNQHLTKMHKALKTSPPPSNLSNFNCPLCFKKFQSTKSLKLHFARIHNLKLSDYKDDHDKADCGQPIPTLVHQCDICDSKFASIQYLRQHQTKMHTDFKYAVHHCEICDSKFDCIESLRQHHTSSHANVQSSSTSSTRAMLSCPLCDKKCNFPSTLKSHITVAHSLKSESSQSTSGATFNCSLCDKKFYFSKALTAHITAAHCSISENIPSTNGKTLDCSLCDKKFRYSRALKAHITLAHKPKTTPPQSSNGKTLDCSFCDKKFRYSKALKAHITLAHTSRMASVQSSQGTTLNCSFCDKKFHFSADLKIHITKAHKSKTMSNTSDSSVKNQSITKLKKTGEQKKHFSETTQSDKSIHKDSKQEVELTCTVLLYCTLCEKDFATHHTLGFHCLTSHDEKSPAVQAMKKPIKCTTCDESFSTFFECRDHSKRIHKISKLRYLQVRKRDFDEYANSNTREGLQPDVVKERQNGQQQNQAENTHDTINGQSIGKRKFDRLDHDKLEGSDTNVKRAKVVNNNSLEEREKNESNNNQGKESDDGVFDYKCNICQHVVADRILFRQHREKTHRLRAVWDTNEKYCNICQRTFASKEQYRFHSEDVHNLFPLSCKKTPKRLK